MLGRVSRDTHFWRAMHFWRDMHFWQRIACGVFLQRFWSMNLL
jgi:hypothetical protein